MRPNNKYKNKSYLYNVYVREQFTPHQIADICGVSHRTIREWLKKFKIHRKRKGRHSQRRRNRRAAIQYKGSRCCICKYSKCDKALEFHHVHPANKSFTISSALAKPWKSIKKELDKCALLCCRCHREVHAGVLDNKLVIRRSNQ